MIGQTISNYRITEKLGEGGMGEVYLAEDVRLERTVAIKILPPELARDEGRRKRFKREAKAASGLSHPNIAHIYDVGEADGIYFIAMEYVKGQTLRERLTGQPLDTAEILDIATQIADALEEAHTQGVVHRDIKPANIALTPRGQVKVLDFGLAKRSIRPAADSQLPTETKTKEGVVMGTVQYMSPEQALGKEIDSRSDLFSLGAVLYEMATGRIPFAGSTATDTIDKIAHAQPEAMARLNYDIPDELERIVRKCLEKDRERRYQTPRDLVVDLQNLRRDSDSEETAATAVAKAAPRPRRRYMAAAAVLVALAALVAAGILFMPSTDASIDSLAVLPFENETGDAELEYLCSGIAESLINTLSQIPDVKVISRTSAFALKDEVKDPQAIGERLDVEAVLLGSLVQRADQISITTELVDVRDNHQLWGEKYNRHLDDVLVIENDITKKIAEGLRLELSGEKGSRLTRRHTDDPEAYRLYLKGREFSVGTGREMDKAIDYFQQAIQKEPSYALAYSGLAEVYLNRMWLMGSDIEEVQGRARAAAEKALEIDENLAEAHAVAAWIKLWSDWDWEGALEEAKRAVELSPGSAVVRMAYGNTLMVVGRHEEALAEALKAQELDPLSTSPTHDVAYFYMITHDYEKAAENFKKAIGLNLNWTWGYIKLAKTYSHMKRCQEALTEAEKAEAQLVGSVDPLARSWLGYTYAQCGQAERARDALRVMEELTEKRYVDPVVFSIVHLGLGEINEAIEHLEKAYQDRTPLMAGMLSTFPAVYLEDLESDPRYQDLVRRMNFP
jgi:TolB-like protein/Flp pilus assembly protein TadD/predicted Ser/Thr protein kinase